MKKSKKPSKAELVALRQRMVFREATADDYNACVAINKNIYGGWDYLPALFMQHVRDPDRRMIVGELDGQVVCLGLTTIIDDGETLLTNSARVSDSQKGSGVWHIMKQQDSHSFDARFAKVRRLRGASAFWDIYKKFNKRGEGYRILGVRNLYKLSLPASAPSPADTPLPEPHLYLESLSKAGIGRLLNNPQNRRNFFPNSQFFFNWDPFEMIPSNIERIVAESGRWIATRDLSSDDKSACRSFSVCRSHFIKHGLKLDLDFHGDDLRELLAHLVVHLRDGQRACVQGQLCVNFLIDQRISTAMLQTVVDRLPGLKMVQGKLPMTIFEGQWKVPSVPSARL